MSFRKKTDLLIDKGINHLNQIDEANAKIRFVTLVKFLVLQTDNQSNKELKDIYFLTVIAKIIWNSCNVGKLEE
jgi:hypothetical protein